MKNVIIGAFLLACTFTATAQTEINTSTQKTQPTATTAQPAASQQQPVAAAQTATDESYAKITQNEIAPAVLNKAVEKYQGYKLVEALVAADGTNYKLVLTKDGKDVAAYYRKNGDFIKEETV